MARACVLASLSSQSSPSDSLTLPRSWSQVTAAGTIATWRSPLGMLFPQALAAPVAAKRLDNAIHSARKLTASGADSGQWETGMGGSSWVNSTPFLFLDRVF